MDGPLTHVGLTRLALFEAFSEAKNPLKPETNEDQIVVVPGSAYAVIDGTTDITGRQEPCA